jgi:hypothetical protein
MNKKKLVIVQPEDKAKWQGLIEQLKLDRYASPEQLDWLKFIEVNHSPLKLEIRSEDVKLHRYGKRIHYCIKMLVVPEGYRPTSEDKTGAKK